MADLHLKGKLAEHLLPRLLSYLCEHRQTGRLVVHRQQVSKTIFLVMGLPANVESSLRDETLGQYLIRQGKITEDECEKSLELMMETGIKAGAALVKMGCLKPKELYHAVKDQTQEKIISCFAWLDGEYEFQADTDFVEDLYRFEMDFFCIMREGLNRFLPPARLKEELDKVPEQPLAMLPGYLELLKNFELAPDEYVLLMQIDGNKSLPDLLASVEKPNFAARTLYLLLLTGIVGPDGLHADAIRNVSDREVEKADIQDFMFPPSTETSPELIEDEEEITITVDHPRKSAHDLLEIYMSIKSEDYFKVLEIPRQATDDMVKRAYLRRSAEFGSEMFEGDLPPEAETKREEIRARIIRSYETLKSETGREEYLQKLEAGVPEQKSHHLQAEKCLQQGMKFVRNRDFPNAQKMFEQAVELKPGEPAYLSYLGWTVYSNPDTDLAERTERAMEYLNQALSRNPNMDSAYVFKGKILKEGGDPQAALDCFRKAMTANPRCGEAEREIIAHNNGQWN